MLLFTPELAVLVSSGKKTQTRRARPNRPCVPGTVHRCYTRPAWLGGQPFAMVEILEVRQERPVAISEADARADGSPDRATFLASFAARYGEASLTQPCWVVRFRLHGDSPQSRSAV